MSQTHVVEPGECLSSIARKYAFVNWRVIWGAPENADLRKKHPNPDIIAPGDKVFIPDKKPREISVAKGESVGVTLKPETTWLRVPVYLDPERKAPKGRWELAIEGVQDLERGDIPADGNITVDVPPTAKNAELRLYLTGGDEPDEIMKLSLGQLDPASTVAGAQERLRRLGYECGAVDGILGVRTRSALLTFQEVNELDPTGKLDQPTVNKLVDLFEGGGAYPQADAKSAPDDSRGADATASDAAVDGELVEVHVEWPAELMERLPDDFVLTLSGPALPPQEVTKDAAGPVDGDMVRFEFEWRDETKVVTLEAAANGQKVTLWRGHVSGDLGVAVNWDQRLDPLLTPWDEAEVAGQPSGAGSVPPDLRAHELSALFANSLL